MRAIALILFVLLTIGSPARNLTASPPKQDPPATERIPVGEAGPSGSFTNAYPRWLSPTIVDAVYTYPPVGNPMVEPVLYDLSVSTDSRNNAHIVGVRQLPADPIQSICYYTNRFESRQVNGFSAYEQLALETLNTFPAEPDISVGPDDVITVVWVQNTTVQLTAQESRPVANIYYQQKTTMGWQAPNLLTDATATLSRTVLFRIPQVHSLPGGDFRVVAAREELGYQNNGGGWSQETYASDIRYIAPPPTSTSEIITAVPDMTPGTLRFDVHPSGEAWVVWQQWVNATETAVFYSNRVGSVWSGSIQLSGIPGYGADVALNSDGEPHFAWIQAGAVTSRFNMGANQPVNVLGGTFARARVLVDSRDQVHVMWNNLAYAARVKNPDPDMLSGVWTRQEPFVAPRPTMLSQVLEVAITANDQIHAVSGGGENMGGSYTRTMEYDLGSRDPLGMVAAAPAMMINTTNGNLTGEIPLFQSFGVGPSTSLSLVYNSLEPYAGLIAQGWKFNYEAYVVDHWWGINNPAINFTDDMNEGVTLFLPSGRAVYFRYESYDEGNPELCYLIADDEYGFFSKLERMTVTGLNTEYLVTTKNGEVWKFNDTGKLAEIQDALGNYLSITYDMNGRLNSIWDMLGPNGTPRLTAIEYLPESNQLFGGRIWRVTDPEGKVYQLTYWGNQLSEVRFGTGTSGPAWSFFHPTTNDEPNGVRVNLVQNIRTPRGVAEGWEWTCRYLQDNRVIEVEDPLVSIVNEAGSEGTATPILTVKYLEEADPQAERVTRVTNRRGISSESVCDYRRSLVFEYRDAACLANTAGIGPVQNTYQSPMPLLLAHQDRWGNSTTYSYHPAGSNSVSPHIADNLRDVYKPGVVGQVHVQHLTYWPDIFNRVRGVYLAPITMSGGIPTSSPSFEYLYDMLGRLETEKYPDVTRLDGELQASVTKGYQYNGPRGQLTRATDEQGSYVEYSDFDSIHGLSKAALRSGGTQPEEFQYSTLGRQTRHRLPRGGSDNAIPGWTITDYDNLYRIEKVTDPAGKETSFGYDVDSNLTSTAPSIGSPVTTTYDRRGFQSGGTSGDGSWTQKVDANGNVRKVQNERGYDTTTTYDSLDRPLQITMPGATTVQSGGGGGGPNVVLQYVNDGYESGTHCSKVTQVGSPDRTTTTFYDRRRRVSSLLQPDGQTKLTTIYNDRDQVKATELRYGSALQTCTVYSRDARDRIHSVTVQDGTAEEPVPTNSSRTVYLLTVTGALETVIDPLGLISPVDLAHKVTYVRDGRDRVTGIIDGFGVLVEHREYGDDDLVREVWVPDPMNKTSTLVLKAKSAYTARKELLWTKDAQDNQTSIEYNDLIGQVKEITDPATIKHKMEYHASSQRKTKEIRAFDPAGDQSQSIYEYSNGVSTATSVFNPDSAAYDATYIRYFDKRGRLEKVVPPIGVSEMRSFDAFSLPYQTLSGSKTITCTHNPLGQVTQRVWSGSHNKAVSYTYDGAGNQTSIQDGTYRQEMLYRTWNGTPDVETFKVWDSGTSEYVTWKSQAHVFDVAGNYVAFVDSESGLHGWDYDSNNRVEYVKYDNVVTSRNYYTPGGLLDYTSIKDEDGSEIAKTTYEYNNLGQRVRSHTERTSVDPDVTLSDLRWGYNSRGLIDKMWVVHQGNLYLEFAYDDRGNLESESTLQGNTGQQGVTLEIAAMSFGYTYDKADNRITKSQNGSTIVDLEYDNPGSRLMSEVSSNGSVAYEYDDWGNLERKTTTEGQTETVELFGYNYLNRLSTYSKEVGETVVAAWGYCYWPAGDRYCKTDLGDAGEPGDDESWLFLHRNSDVSTVYTKSGNGSPEHSQTYVQGVGIDSKSLRIKADGTRRHFISDAVGTTGMTLDDDGAKEEECIRDVWGNSLAGETGDERFGFAQRENDLESGLVYMRHRMYDPRIGRFTQMDSVLVNQPTDHYLYAMNSPVNHRDSWGTCSICDPNPCTCSWFHRAASTSLGRSLWLQRAALSLFGDTGTDLQKGLDRSVDAASGMLAGAVKQGLKPLPFQIYEEASDVISLTKAGMANGKSPAAGLHNALGVKTYERAPLVGPLTDFLTGNDNAFTARTNRLKPLTEEEHLLLIPRIVGDSAAIVSFAPVVVNASAVQVNRFLAANPRCNPANFSVTLEGLGSTGGNVKITYVGPKTVWPSTAEEMNAMLGFEGIAVRDRITAPLTPGRNRIDWSCSSGIRVTLEQHPYDIGAPASHTGLHWHLNLKGVKKHQTFLPGDPFPAKPAKPSNQSGGQP